MARGYRCFAHVHRSLVPIERHHVQPLSRGGPNVRANLEDGCANAHSDAHYLLDAIEDARGYDDVPVAVKRSFSAGVRRIALRGWAAYADQFLAGRLWREVSLWSTDGLPRSRAVPPYSHAAAIVGQLEAESVVASPEFSEWCRHQLRQSSPPASR